MTKSMMRVGLIWRVLLFYRKTSGHLWTLKICRFRTRRFLPDRRISNVRPLGTPSGLLHRPRIDKDSDSISHRLGDVGELTAEYDKF